MREFVQIRTLLLLTAALVAAPFAAAAVLPEDRADLLYHRYDGGGVKIDGPSLLVRKKFADKVSVSANYYVDMVSSASIDVVSTASPYEEERTQYSLGVDYLRGKSTYSVGYINSSESDYKAKTFYLGISQDMFGDLTTVSFGFKRGINDVFRNIKTPQGESINDPAFQREVATRSFSAGVTQVLTRSLLGVVTYEVMTDEGFLNSPYRSSRFVDASTAAGFRYESEIYPATRTTQAAAVRLKYSLPWWRASVDGQYRFFTDTWGITADTLHLGYTHPVGRSWTIDGSARYYQQNRADFYSDLFPRANAQNFRSRDKELATFNALTLGVGATWEFRIARAPWLEKGTLNVRYDHMMINYDDFRDVTKGPRAGLEPLYKLNSNVIELFVSAWF
jgi:hypothetical protein